MKEVIVLRCHGQYVGSLENGRYLDIPCRHKLCRRDGQPVTHRFDLVTGRFTTTARDEREGADSDARPGCTGS